MPAAEVAAQGVGAIIGLAQTFMNNAKEKRANRELKNLFSKRKAFETPEEIFDMLNLSQFNAAQGFSDETMSYLTGQAGAGLVGGLGTASRLGADPNQLAGLIDNYYQDIFKVGAENELTKMKKFDSFTNALGLVAQNAEAEWQSQDNLIKDQMQAVASRVGAANQGQQSGLNLTLSSLAALATNNLYGGKTPNRTAITASTTPATVPARSPLDFTIGNQRGNFTI